MSSSNASTFEPHSVNAHDIGRRACLAWLGVVLMNLGCRTETAQPVRSAKKRPSLDAAEFFPADLDVVLRVDLERMRVGLGPTTDGLSERLGSQLNPEDELISRAIKRARVAWIGSRLADLDKGDRVLVIEGDVEDLRPDSSLFQVVDPPLAEGVTTFERRGPLARDVTARIHLLGPRMIVFVSGVEVDGVERIFLRGPDPGRRDPSADGLLSVDLRGRRLPADLERRFPSIGSVIRGVKRARATVTMVDEGLRADIEIATVSDAASTKLEGFLSALREGGQGSRYADLFDGLRLERIERAVHIRWIVSTAMLRAALEHSYALHSETSGS